jgi:HK97 family phage portal protein
MSIVRKSNERRALPTNIDPYGITARPQFSNYSGEVVNEMTALANTAVLASCMLLADAIACMPLELIKERAGGRLERMPTPSVFQQPNDRQTMFEFIHEAVFTLAIHGSDYIYAPMGSNGMPVELVNFHPNLVRDLIKTDTGFDYAIGKEMYNRDVIRGVHWIMLPNRVRGVSPIEVLRNTIGVGLAMDKFLAQFYGDGATPSSVLETDGTLTPEQARQTRETWEDSLYRRRRPAVLSGGLKWRPVVTSAADSQMLEHREAIVRDIARAYRIPLHLIGGVGGQNETYQNVESAGISFVRYTLLPWMHRIEDVLSSMLPVNMRVKFNADEFMRADLSTRVRAQQAQIMSGTLTPNEARNLENREPYEGGDQFVLGIAGAPVAGVEGGELPTLGTDALVAE